MIFLFPFPSHHKYQDGLKNGRQQISEKPALSQEQRLVLGGAKSSEPSFYVVFFKTRFKRTLQRT